MKKIQKYQVIQAVTFLSTSWRSPISGHVFTHHPKKVTAAESPGIGQFVGFLVVSLTVDGSRGGEIFLSEGLQHEALR